MPRTWIHPWTCNGRSVASAVVWTLLASSTPLLAQVPDPLGLPPVELPAALDRVLRDYERAWKEGDGELLAALFTIDGMTLANESLPVRGRSAIAAGISKPGGDLQLRAFAWATSDTVGYIIGGFRYPTTTGPGGKFVLALRRGPDGRWFIAADIDNAASRPRAP
jgi:hypothetical protein